MSLPQLIGFEILYCGGLVIVLSLAILDTVDHYRDKPKILSGPELWAAVTRELHERNLELAKKKFRINIKIRIHDSIHYSLEEFL